MRPTLSTRFAIVAAMTIATSGCDDEVVFRDRELFNPPPDAASGFLGYFDAATDLTTCGNCHVGIQRDWAQTDHADAYATLANSGHDQPFCFACHTVNEKGNAVTATAGWNAVQDSAYRDVQCESCHGPGLDHVTDPDATQPVASIKAVFNDSLSEGCAECHQGSHHPFAEEWSRSAHAEPVSRVVSLAQSDPSHYTTCLGCHTAQGALEAWGVVDEYLEADAAVADHLGITCAVCHDPHGSDNTAQLRFPIDVPSQEVNLCMKCHHKRAAPEVDADVIRGPHSPEGPLLLGEGAGWFPPGFQTNVDRILGTHGSIGNTRTCAACHVAKLDVSDEETGEFIFSSTGHLFLAIPCVDAQGIPTTAQDCTVTERQFSGCTASGCHGTTEVARSVFTTAKQRIDNLVAEVDRLLALPGPAADFDRSDGIFKVADGAWFNARLGELPGTSTHNPFLIEQLLTATVQALMNTYGVSSPISLELIF